MISDKLLFSDRNKLSVECKRWLEDHPEIENCPLNIITWCNIIGILDINKAKEYIKHINE